MDYRLRLSPGGSADRFYEQEILVFVMGPLPPWIARELEELITVPRGIESLAGGRILDNPDLVIHGLIILTAMEFAITA